MYYAVQVLTLGVLVLAANTSFQGFPRLAALLARDGFAPRQFTNLGDRLVFSNGMLVLASLAALLLWIYSANVDSLIHLYVIGVFTAFTLSQAGMVRYWRRVRGPRWQYRALVNGVGATATGIVAAVVIVTKFAAGAWLVIVAIPLLVLLSYGIRRHYRGIARRLSAGAAAVVAAPPPSNTTLLLVESIDEATADALWFARTTGGGKFRAIHIPVRGADPGIKPRWFRFSDEQSHLEILDRPLGFNQAVLEQVWSLPRGESSFVTVVIPELFQGASLLETVRSPRALLLKLRLLSEPGVVVADVPALAGANEAPPERAVVRVLVSGVNATSMRAVNYARTLGVTDTRAVSFAFSPEEGELLRQEWLARGAQIPLEIDDAPYRDIGAPLLSYLRRLTEDESVEVIVVMPELVVRGARRVLHNQRALYLKRLLLFEPRVILVSVPYQLIR
jgi:hypothetical protein